MYTTNTLCTTYTKKDFAVDWYNGSGCGGQNRNKHANCVRITHKPTGLRAQSTRHKERTQNLKDAFTRLAGMIVQDLERVRGDGRSPSSIVRSYNLEDNRVSDYGSGIKDSPKKVLDGDLEQFRTSYDPSLELPRSGRTGELNR